MEKLKDSQSGQKMPAYTEKITEKDFTDNDGTKVYWLGNASILINSRGEDILIDPLLEGFDMPLLIDMPIEAKNVPDVDGVLITHIDNDHFSRPTLKTMGDHIKSLHAPQYVSEEADKEGLPNTNGYKIGDSFEVGDIDIKLTPAKHNWQNFIPKYNYREWKEDEYCGFWIETPDGTIWLPGDSQLLEEQLQMPEPDVILLDFANNDWHITFDGAVKLANTYPNAKLIPIHWGSVDAPEMNTFNGNPEELAAHIDNPERLIVLNPGESYKL